MTVHNFPLRPSDDPVETKIAIMYPNRAAYVFRELSWPRNPPYRLFTELLTPILEGDLEHVTVLADFSGGRNYKPADMFVDEQGLRKGLERNEAATTIYRRNWMMRHPGTDPELLPHIAGPAVLFNRKVWV